MAELVAAEVYAPRTIQVWRTLLNWMAFFFHIFAQILRGTPSFSRVLSYVGLHYGSLISSGSQGTPQFMPLPAVELLEYDEEVENGKSTLPPSSVRIAAGVGIVREEQPSERLKVVLDLDETLVCAYETLSFPFAIRSQATEAGLKWFELECVSSDKE